MLDLPTSADVAELKGVSRKDYFESRGYRWEEVEKILRLNRNYKAMVNAQEDEHHLVSRAKGGADVKINRKKMRRGDHVHWHDAFGIRTPGEQVSFVLDFNRKVFLPDIPYRIYDILDSAQDKGRLYKKEVFK